MAETRRRPVKARRVVSAPPEVVWAMLTAPPDLTAWLCNEARCQPRPGGRYELRWPSGYHVLGTVKAAEKPKLLAVAWWGKGEPGETEVTFSLSPRRSRTEVTVTHAGFGRGPKWARAVDEARKGWATALENLQYLAETGLDRRDAQRPLMGINFEVLDAERAAKEGIAVTSGIYLTGLSEDGGAKAAGLRKGDVITAIDGKAIPDFDTLHPILQSHRAGDKIEVAYVRGKEQGTVTVELKPRPIPEIPADLKALVAGLRERNAAAHGEVAAALAGVSEERAERSPKAGEWCAKEILAHLCSTERYTRFWIVQWILGNDPFYGQDNFDNRPEELVPYLVTKPSVAALLARLAQEQDETLAMVGALKPEIVANKARYRRIGQTVWDAVDHTRDHVAQIKAAVQ